MSKDTEIRFVGQPIFGQILKLIDKSTFVSLVREKMSDHYYKAFKSWDQLVVMLFGILSRCDSMAETCEGIKALSGKLNQLGLQKAAAKSTAGDGLRNRGSSFFESLYYKLVDRYKGFLSDSRTYGLTFKELLIIDSTTIRLFSDILKGVGRNPKNDGKKKGGLKVHMLIDAVQSIAKFVRITEAKVHDKNFLQHLQLPAHSMMVFDKAYNYYRQFARWTEKKIYFVTRQKDNAVCRVLETIMEKELLKGEFGVYKEEVIELIYKESEEEKKLKLRRINYRDDRNRQFVFITNNFEITVEEVAFIYKRRWQIELLFKKMKQNFQLHYFYGENENAIRTQVWCTLIAQLLLTVLQKMADVKKAFSTVATLVRIHLISLLDVYELLRNVKRTYTKKKPEALPSLFAGLT
ncbi:MAG: IS4 family transposase [Bacteroidota bacterium]